MPDVIYSYSRSDALVDVSGIAREAGFTIMMLGDD